MKQFKNHYGFAHLLNLLVPGLGHAFWGEYLFAAFVFLIILVAAVLFFFCFLVSLPFTFRAILFGLPAIFYLFTFVDLERAIEKRRGKVKRSTGTAWLLLAIGVAAQLMLPTAPVNFFVRNAPDLVRQDDNRLAPLVQAGDICYVNSVAYKANLFFLDAPLTHALPDRWDLVRYRDPELGETTGLVLGNSQEELAFVNDTLFVDGYPLDDPDETIPIAGGEMSLTLVDPGSILVAKLENGRVRRVRQVPIGDVIGKVHCLF
jgi:hypothetical protein